MKKLIFFWKELLATFWFLPMLIIFMAVLLSAGLVSIDNRITVPNEGIMRFFLVNSTDSARSILSTISGAMIGAAGTVFSVTLVALTLASSQFGPRLIKNFMYVRLNQLVLGSYVATFLYCLLVLNSVQGGSDYSFIPSISILVACLATIANIILLIVFIHNIAVSIQADKVVADISDFIEGQLVSLFPDKMGEEFKEEEAIDVSIVMMAYQSRIPIRSSKSGYLQYISNETLMDTVSDQDALLRLDCRPGDYLVKDCIIGELFSHTKWEEGKVDDILNQFVIGKTKTAQQDLEFSIHQMVEIAARALSPGVNDPYTAIACIDNLMSTMSYLAGAKFPSKNRLDSDGNLRIIANTLDFEGMLDAAFNQIRQFAGGNTAVLIRLIEALTMIHGFTKTETQKEVVIKHAKMVLNIGDQSIKEENDINDLKERAEKLLKD